MKKFYTLLTLEVVYVKEKIERIRKFNILRVHDNPGLTRLDLGTAQQQAQVRFFTEFDTKRKSEVKDVVIASSCFLGHMTAEEFNEGFEEARAESEQPTEQTLEEQPVDEPEAPVVATVDPFEGKDDE